MNLPGPGRKKSVLKVTTITILTISASVCMAVIPLLGTFEDFFVNGMKYDPNNPLFVGLPGKDQHFKAIKEYYGRMKKSTLSWSLTNRMVDNMFTQQNIGHIERKKVAFFGNDVVCLFKYFANSDDPHLPFVSAVLALNFACFMIITISYNICFFGEIYNRLALFFSFSNYTISCVSCFEFARCRFDILLQLLFLSQSKWGC